MSNSRRMRATRVAVVLVCVMWFGSAAVAQDAQRLPAGAGSEIVRAKCLVCHEADLIVQQRLTSAGWQRELEKMIRWGAAVAEGERNSVIAYLAANFGPQPVNAALSPASERGAEVFTRACLVCHQADLVEQQRLSRPGWVREIDKMIRWGASVADTEKDLLTDYLAARFGPR